MPLGKANEGIALLSETVASAADIHKHPITPGEIITVNELYGDMLIDAGRYQQALEAYKSSLKKAPRRLNSLKGIRKALLAMNEVDSAKTYSMLIHEQVNAQN